MGYKRVHIIVREDLYKALWDYIKKKYDVPIKKFSLVVNEALEEYLRNRGIEVGSGE